MKASAQLFLGIALPILTLVSGCKSCREAPPPPAAVPQEGRLPRAPERPATPVGTPFIPPPSCGVISSPSVDTGVAPLEVHFTAEGMCTDAEGKFSWDFGDGTPPVEEQNPVHVYRKPGTYTVRVTLSDPEHNTKDVDETEVTVTAE